MIDMDICDEINNLRNRGYINCGIVDESLNLKKLASRFELFFKPNLYKKINYKQAASLLRNILHRDLAYNSKIMSQAKAENLTTRFLDCFDKKSIQYYTNGDFYEINPTHRWNPATSTTFDTGILVISKSKSGCLWVEDED
ncbi:MAG: hypothetical protein AAGG00_05430 [Cyanobacteria bacterium P01_H01_bin.150]